MYSKIDTDNYMITMERLFQYNKNSLPEDYPATTIIELLNLFIQKNMFISIMNTCTQRIKMKKTTTTNTTNNHRAMTYLCRRVVGERIGGK